MLDFEQEAKKREAIDRRVERMLEEKGMLEPCVFNYDTNIDFLDAYNKYWELRVNMVASLLRPNKPQPEPEPEKPKRKYAGKIVNVGDFYN